MPTLIIAAYFVALAGLSLLGLHRLWMVFVAARAGPPQAPERAAEPDWPAVLVQLPIYNEALVTQRLLESVGRLDYPRDRLRIQVLDDSTDETQRIVDRVAETLRAQGLTVDVVRRADRVGYKAGALAFGLEQSREPLIAIFDADFVPNPDYLRRIVPSLTADPGVGMVQARWGHLNRGRSWLTRAQAVFLDGHFAVEHRARARAGHFFNFNGTAGVWRRQAIEDAGGWRALTITEDLDLSYRAQLAGWRFEYRDDVVTPAELPDSWIAFRAQQARWVRGSVETARLLLRPVVTARLPISVRFDALIHLGHNFAYLGMAILATLLPAAVILRDQLGWRVPGGQALLSILDLSMLSAGTCAMFVFYGLAAVRTSPGVWSRPFEIFFALCVGAGMSLTNSAEVLIGLRSRGSEFVRTPKRGDGPTSTPSTYRSPVHGGRIALELVFLAYFCVGVGFAARWSLFGALPFLIMYALGFAAVSLGSIREIVRPRPEPDEARSGTSAVQMPPTMS